MRRIALQIFLASVCTAVMGQRVSSLVPSQPSMAPDYYCTWNLQGYVTNYGSGAGSNDLRIEIHEDNLFGSQLGYKAWGRAQQKSTLNNSNPRQEVTWSVDPRYQGWLSHYPMLHADLTFVMDDSWDIPRGPGDDGASKRPHGRNYDNEYLATMAVDVTRFPSFQGDDVQRMKSLVEVVKALGWRSLGGWVCAQDPIGLTQKYTGMDNTYENALRWTASQEERFWKQRLAESQNAGFTYWKVDWGNKDRDEQFRRRLSQWALEVAPDVVIEHASFQDGGPHHPEYISFSQTIRSYDVNNNIAQAQTIQRLRDLAVQPDAEREGWGIINCEDEPYIAAGLGCAIGVMRHPYVGSLPNGKPDSYFADDAPKARRLKNRLNEIVRAVRWHRIALPFGHSRQQWLYDSELLQESGNGKRWEAPARMSRRMPLPQFVNDADAASPLRPYLLASVYDNGCAAIAIINRNIDGIYRSERADVSCQPLRWDRKVGVFGYCRSLKLTFQNGLPNVPYKVYAQDLASDGNPTELSFTLTSDGCGIVIQGADLEALCVGHDYPYSEVQREAGKDYADLSDPAVVLQIVPQWTTIYDESLVPPYVLPDPLVCADGHRVTSRSEWEQVRRPELLNLLTTQMYGVAPVAKPVKSSVISEKPLSWNPKVTHQSVRVQLTPEVTTDVNLYVPRQRKPAPLFLVMGFRAEPDSAALVRLLSAGYAVAQYRYSEAVPDDVSAYRKGLIPAFYAVGQQCPKDGEWGTVAAWAWTASRVLDVLSADARIDGSRIALLGHSRLGKAALWAAATDERVKVVFPVNSGCCGTALSRRRFGETVYDANRNFPHWFCENYKQYSLREDDMPFDQHEVVALIAPRTVYIASAEQDSWADQRGEFLGGKGAEPVYALYGLQGIGTSEMPLLDTPLNKGAIAYHIRRGGHAVLPYDWEQFIIYANRVLK